MITQWQTFTSVDTSGTDLTLVVVAPAASGQYTVVGADTETIPTPLPPSGIASFTLAHPIVVAAGDMLGLTASTSDNVLCFYSGGSIPAADVVVAASGTVSTGQTLSTFETGGSIELALSATLAPIADDASVQTSTIGSPASVGSAAVLTSTVTSNGPAAAPITFTDQVPSGLTISSASSTSGSCTVDGQTVSCPMNGLAIGQHATVNVVVTPTAPGTYMNNVSVSVASPALDPVASDNAASSTLAVGTFPQQCIVPGLRKLTVAYARTLLHELGCGVTVINRRSSLGKGLVIKTSQVPGSYAYHQLITLFVSSGPRSRHKHR
jgi:uncharacterized repeat protein (TIGR01451 family)